MSLEGGFLEPCEGCGLVLRHAFTAKIQIRKIELSLDFARLGRLAIPMRGCGVVLCCAQTAVVE
jgi:hypothetical protein